MRLALGTMIKTLPCHVNDVIEHHLNIIISNLHTLSTYQPTGGTREVETDVAHVRTDQSAQNLYAAVLPPARLQNKTACIVHSIVVIVCFFCVA